MEKELDELLRHALTPMEEPDSRLNQKILERQAQKALDPAAAVREGGRAYGPNRKKTNCYGRQRGADMDFQRTESDRQITGARGGLKIRRLSAAAIGAAILIGAGSLSAIAAYKYLTWENVAEEAGDVRLAEVISRGGIAVDETQTWGGYSDTLMGIVSGEGISEWTRTSGGEVRADRSYAVVAVRNTDGSPVQDSSFFVSPLIEGYHPAFYNAASMHGDYTEVLKDGVLYRLVGCDNVEIFADHKLYLCVSDGTGFYNRDAYLYDEETGDISRNEEYQGLNALFGLPLDAAKADPEKAAEYMESLGITVRDIPEEKRNVELEDGFKPQAAEGNEQGAEAAEYALQFVGNPYVWGGESLTEGCDSSGFVKGVFGHFDIMLPHGAAQQRKYGEEVQGLENAQPGDLLFYEEPSHVAIYIGDGKIVHADPELGICVSDADYVEIAAIKRVF